MGAARFIRDFLARCLRDTHDGFWNALDWLGF